MGEGLSKGPENQEVLTALGSIRLPIPTRFSLGFYPLTTRNARLKICPCLQGSIGSCEELQLATGSKTLQSGSALAAHAIQLWSAAKLSPGTGKVRPSKNSYRRCRYPEHWK